MKRTFLIMIAAASAVFAQKKLEDLGVAGIQAIFKGSPQDIERIARMVDDDLTVNPNHALAKLLRGVIIFNRSGDAAKHRDMASAGKLYQQGIDEMGEAVRLELDNVGVRAPRGAIFIAASRSMPTPMAKPLLDAGVGDFEHLLNLQKKDGSFAKLSNHQRGELLTGLADGWIRSGNEAKGRA
jgi:hypothetical protein